MVSNALLDRFRLLDSQSALDALREAGLDTADGLSEVLHAAEEMAWAEPGSVAKVANKCRIIAEGQSWAPVIPAARYLEAQMCAAAGAFQDARQHVLSARREFLAVGDHTAAARTGLGLAHVEAMDGKLSWAEGTLEELIETTQGDSEPELQHIATRARQNLAAVQVMQGRYETAVDLLTQAEREYRQAGNDMGAHQALNNRCIALLGLGRVHEAIQAVAAALESGPSPTVGIGDLHDTLGRASLLSGHFADALTNLQAALALFEDHGAASSAVGTELALGDVWLTLSMFSEAEIAFRNVIRPNRPETSELQLGWATLGLGQALLGKGDRSEAATRLTTARHIFETSGAASGEVLSLLALTAMEERFGNRKTRRQYALAAKEIADRETVPCDQLLVELALADLEDAEEHLERARRLAETVGIPQLVSEYEFQRGRHHRKNGQTALAKQHLYRCTKILEDLRGTTVSERHRRWFLTNRLEAHDQLIQILVQEGGPEDLREAFDVVENVRARALLDTMAGLLRVKATPADPRQREQIEQALTDAQSLYNSMLGDDELRGVRVSSLPALQPHRQGRRLHRAVPVEGSNGVPTEPGSTAKVAGLSAVQAALAEDDATLISYHCSDQQLLAFVVSRDQLRVEQLPVTQAKLRELVRALDAQMTRFRGGAAFVQRWASSLEQATEGVLRDLYDALLRPLGLIPGTLDEPRRLVIAPCGLLNSVPFHAVVGDDGPLVKHAEVVLVPSGSTWLNCRNRQPAQGAPHVIGSADSFLPSIDSEIEQVSEILGSRTVVASGSRANTSLLQAVSAPSVAHIACHGAFHAENPMFSSLRLSDGVMTAYELAATDLQGSLVSLSACESGRGVVLAGEENLGFLRSALSAGAKDIVASGWLAHDGSTNVLMAEMYRWLCRGETPAAALRKAQLRTRDDYPHPFYWAPFAVTGSGFGAYQHLNQTFGEEVERQEKQ